MNSFCPGIGAERLRVAAASCFLSAALFSQRFMLMPRFLASRVSSRLSAALPSFAMAYFSVGLPNTSDTEGVGVGGGGTNRDDGWAGSYV